jgi:HEAT repeats
VRFPWLACALVVLGGCPRKAAPLPPQVAEVRVLYKGQDLEGAPKLDEARLHDVASAAIAKSAGLVVHEDGGADATPDVKQPRYRLRVDLEIGAAEDERSKKGNLRALVAAKLEPIGGEPGALSFEQSALAERAFVVGAKGEPNWQAHAERSIGDCVAGVGARVKLAAGDAGALAAAIDGSDEDLRDEAMTLAAERKTTVAVPALIRRLKSDDHAVRDRAIGALSAIGDPRAVHPLTDVAKFYDVGDLPKVLDALATIGGPEARAYLEFVASGHDNPEMRELAKQAIGHLERHEAERNRDLAVPSRF